MCFLRTLSSLSLMLLLLAFGPAVPSRGASNDTNPKIGMVECSPELIKQHNPGLAGNADRLVCFQGYISNVNTLKRSDKPQFLAGPHWVVHHITPVDKPPVSGPRPSPWFTVPELAQQGIPGTDDSYAFSKAFETGHKNWYDRGHLAQKYLVERFGKDAALFTHNMANAVPQRHQLNAGAWLTLECMTGAWANKFGEVWVIAGPVFKKGRPVIWLRSDKNKKATPVAIPVGVYKIVARKHGERWDVLAFVYPQTNKTFAKGPFDPEVWLKSVADVEQLTGEHFLSGLPDADELRKKTATHIWTVSKSDYDLPACRQQTTTIQ
jgi:endonuclease G